MSLVLSCPRCACPCKVPDSAAGKTAKCPRCATLIAVPPSDAAPGPVASPVRRAGGSWRRIGVGSLLALVLAGGGLAVWFLWPRSTTSPQGNNAPVVVSNDAPRDTSKQPAPGEVKAKPQPQLQAERKRSRQNLEQIAMALHDHGEAVELYPPSALVDQPEEPASEASKPGSPAPALRPLLSWRVLILPFLGENKLFREFKLDEPWDSPHNKKLLARMPKVYAPVHGKTPQPYMTYYQVFTGPETPFPAPVFLGPNFPPEVRTRGVPFPGRILDGTHNTLLVVEAGEPVPWTKSADLAYEANKPLPRLGGLFADGFHAAVCDGTVFFIPRDFDEKILRALVTCAGAEPVNPEQVLKSPAEEDEEPPLDDKSIKTYLWSITANPSPAFRLRCVKGLSRLLQQARSDKKLQGHVLSAREELSKATWDRDEKVSRAAIETLGLSGSPSKETVFTLLTPIDGPWKADWTRFEPIAQAIAARGKAVAPVLLEGLSHDDYDIRARAAFILRLLVERELLRIDPKAPVRRGLVPSWGNWLTWLPRNSPIRKPLIEREKRFARAVDPAANDQDAAERTLALLEIWHDYPREIHSGPVYRERALVALAKMGPLGRVSLPELFRSENWTAEQIRAAMREKETSIQEPRNLSGAPEPLPNLATALAGDPVIDANSAEFVVSTVHRALDHKGTPLGDPDLKRLTPRAVANLQTILRCPKQPPWRKVQTRPPDGGFVPADERAPRKDDKMDKPKGGPGIKPDFGFWSSLQAEAARALGRIGPAAREATPDLLRMLKVEDENGRFQAARALLLIDPDNRTAAVPVLKGCLTVDRHPIAMESALLLVDQNVVDRAVFDALRTNANVSRWAFRSVVYGDVEWQTRLSAQARKALCDLGRPLLQDADREKRRDAAWLLAPFDTDACLPVLLSFLKDGRDDEIRVTEAILGRLGPKAKAAFEPLCARLEQARKSGSLDVRGVLQVLPQIDPDAGIAILWKTWRNKPAWKYTNVPEDAYSVLLGHGPRLRWAIPDLIADLKSPNESDELSDKLISPRKAVKLLACIGVATVPALQELAIQGNAAQQQRAAQALGQIGADAKPAVPALLKLLAAEDANVRREAAVALSRIAPRDHKIVSALISLHQDREADVRRHVVRALGGAGPKALAVLKESLEDKDGDVRLGAAAALARVGAEARPALLEAAKHKDTQVRRLAVLALGNLGPDTPGTLPALIEATRDRDRLTRRLAVALLDRHSDQAAQVVPVVATALTDEDADVRWTAAFVLEEMGANAAAAVPALNEALKDKNKHVQRRARIALQAISAKAKGG